MNDSPYLSPKRWRLGLRYKVALLFGVPILVIAFLLLLFYYLGEKKVLEEQADISSIQMGSVIVASMKHTMMINDRSMMQNILTEAGHEGDITRIWIIDPNGVVKLSSIPSEVQTQVSTQSMGCIECHQYPPASRPRTIEINNTPSTIRVITPIAKDAECIACHPGNEKHLGVLLTDMSLAGTENQLNARLRGIMIMVLALIALAIVAAVGMVNLLVVRRIEVMQHAMDSFEKGDYSVRVNQRWRTDDEFTWLADSFNRMVTSIAHHKEELEKITQARQQAIMDERERIARELHDGVAQFLGYVNTKIVAISTLLDKNEIQPAQKHINQMMKAVQDQSVDVRASIVGLKMAESGGEDLAGNLREYIRQCNQLLDVPVEIVVASEAENLRLDPDVELHLVRIVQEAISNIRKHAQAKHALVKLAIEDEMLVLTIQDDGSGFNPWQLSTDYQPHFGLQTMRERAELAGAQFSLVSEPGIGTTVSLRLHKEKA